MTLLELTTPHARVLVNFDHVAYCTPSCDKQNTVLIFSDSDHTELQVQESLTDVLSLIRKEQ